MGFQEQNFGQFDKHNVTVPITVVEIRQKKTHSLAFSTSAPLPPQSLSHLIPLNLAVVAQPQMHKLVEPKMDSLGMLACPHGGR